MNRISFLNRGYAFKALLAVIYLKVFIHFDSLSPVVGLWVMAT